jgi:gamma-glutamyl hercynylcysteine S-oxide synthase
VLVADDFRNADCSLLAQHLNAARQLSLDTFLLYEEALTNSETNPEFLVPKVPQLNPPLWELGHIAWFQERWLLRNPDRHLGTSCHPNSALRSSILPAADAYFDSSSVAHSTRWDLTLPSLKETKSYLKTTLELSLNELHLLPTRSENQRYLFWLCAAHEYMHAEAFAYMANSLGFPNFNAFRHQAFSGTQVIFGANDKSLRGADFAFDNESCRFQAIESNTPACDLDEHPVSWADFQAFMNSVAGKAFAQQRTGWVSRAQPLLLGDDSSPVCQVTFDEAAAWCHARGRALPSEGQWLAEVKQNDLPWGLVWEWTSSVFKPYPGFVAHPYADYSQPWFDGEHRVLKGGSIITSEAMKHPLYRNFFRPERNDVFTGFRSCRLMP